MRNPFLYLALTLGLICWSMPPCSAKNDEAKLSKAEKRELKKKEKEAKKAAKKKAKKGKSENSEEGADDAEDEDKNKKADKKAVSKAMKSLNTDYGKAKGNGKFYMYVDYTTMNEAGEEMLKNLVAADKDLKKAKVNVLLINGFSSEEDMPDAIKELKRMKVKYPMVKKSAQIEEDLPGYTGGTAPSIAIVTPSGEVKASGGAELLDTWHTVVGVKIMKKAAAEAEEEEETEE